MKKGDRVKFTQHYSLEDSWAIVNHEPKEGAFKGDYSSEQDFDIEKPNKPLKASIVETDDGGSYCVPVESISSSQR